MATYVNNLRLKEITTGDESGTWGTSTNTNLELIADAFGYSTEALASDADATITMADGAADGVRALYLKITSGVSLTATRTVTLAPNTVSKVWIIENATTGSQSITIAQGSGSTVTIASGKTAMVYTDGGGATAAVTNALTNTTMVAPVLGTPASATLTNATGLPLTTGVTGTLPVGNGGTGATTLTANNVLLGNGTSALQVVAPGTSGNVLTSNGTTWSSTAPAVTLAGNNAFTGANTFYNTTGQTFAPATANDGIIVKGRAGGTATYRSTLTPTTLSASRTVTFPDADTTVPVATQVITFSGPTAARTFTFPDASTTVLTTNAAVTVAQGGTGLTTLTANNVILGNGTSTPSFVAPSTNGNVLTSNGTTWTSAAPAVTLAGNNAFTGANTYYNATGQTFGTATTTQDGIIVAGRAGGSSSYRITLAPATLAASRTLSLPDPGSNETLGYQNIPQNSQSAAYTLVLTDAGKQIFHPSADTTARTFTIPANSSVAYPVGTAVTFINQNGAGVITIAITTDTMRLAGAGTTGSRTLAANGVATAVKVTSTEWIISGTGLT